LSKDLAGFRRDGNNNMVNAATYPQDELKRPLLLSLAVHALLIAALILSNFLSRRGEVWGGPGSGAVSVGLVGSLPGVPLPRPEVVTTSRVVDETRGLYKSEPKAKAAEETAQPLPEFEKNKPKKYVTRPSRVLEDDTPPPPGAIPYGQGGAPSIPYTQFSMGTGSQGAMSFGGQGGGDFGGRFPWYVEAVRRRVSSNWIQSTVDPTVRWAPRAVVSFQILRDGNITSIQVLRSSGNASVDRSAVRAIQGSSPLERLPNEYNGSFVLVEFWFDFRR
jgi:protein TonB